MPTADELTVTDDSTTLTASGFAAKEKGHWEILWLDEQGNMDDALEHVSGYFTAKPDGSVTFPLGAWYGKVAIEDRTERVYGSGYAKITTDNVELEIRTT